MKFNLSRLDKTYFNRLATHFNITLLGHQTMLNDFWLPNISRLDRPLGQENTTYCSFPTYGVGCCFAQAIKSSITKQVLMEARGRGRGVWDKEQLAMYSANRDEKGFNGNICSYIRRG